MSGNILERKYAMLLMKLGIKPHIRGYHYLLCGFVILEEKKDPLIHVSIEFYDTIADKFEATGSQVERAIRHAIGMASVDNTEVWIELFGKKRKPSNSQFIATVYETSRLSLLEDIGSE